MLCNVPHVCSRLLFVGAEIMNYLDKFVVHAIVVSAYVECMLSKPYVEHLLGCLLYKQFIDVENYYCEDLHFAN